MTTYPLFLFPPIGFVYEVANQKCVYLEVFESFPKQTFRNRIEIISSQGIQRLVVPLKHRKSKTITKDIKISYAENWTYFFEKAIRTSYGNSPYFDYYFSKINSEFNKKPAYLIDLNWSILHALKVWLSLEIEFEKTKKFINTKEYLVNLKKDFSASPLPAYYQLFEEQNGFVPNLSILDLLFMKGPETSTFLIDN